MKYLLKYFWKSAVFVCIFSLLCGTIYLFINNPVLAQRPGDDPCPLCDPEAVPDPPPGCVGGPTVCGGGDGTNTNDGGAGTNATCTDNPILFNACVGPLNSNDNAYSLNACAEYGEATCAHFDNESGECTQYNARPCVRKCGDVYSQVGSCGQFAECSAQDVSHTCLAYYQQNFYDAGPHIRDGNYAPYNKYVFPINRVSCWNGNQWICVGNPTYPTCNIGNISGLTRDTANDETNPQGTVTAYKITKGNAAAFTLTGNILTSSGISPNNVGVDVWRSQTTSGCYYSDPASPNCGAESAFNYRSNISNPPNTLSQGKLDVALNTTNVSAGNYYITTEWLTDGLGLLPSSPVRASCAIPGRQLFDTKSLPRYTLIG